MNSAILLLIAIICFTAGYRLYGRFLSRRIFELDSSRPTPAHTENDGVDFVPAPNWWVLFGHHFSSICGAGPIIGPALACAYWGWGVGLIWLIIGSVWMGAVSDFSSLVMSVRAKGQSIAQIAGVEISTRVKFYFLIFLWVSLILVIAVFSIFAAKTFTAEPDAVIPSFGLIPTAVLAGWMLYYKKISNVIVTPVGLGALVFLLYLGTRIHVIMPAVGPVDGQACWILILLAYCFVASVVPVNILLQPRDYLASFILFALIFLGIAGVLVKAPRMDAPAFTQFAPVAWPEAGPLWPMLFVTIACGAISGFHALVSSGTTCKQIATEAHACRIGYGGMLVESLVGVLVIIAVTAGLGSGRLSELLANGGPIAAFSHGYGSISEVFLGGYGKSFAVLALNAFILTTLDSATRITRYITAELFGVSNKYLATAIAVAASGILAMTGKWNLLWPAFGAANQLIAGITLMVASCWLLNRGRSFYMTLIPACFMLVTTIAAFALQIIQALGLNKSPVSPDWLMVVVPLLLIGLAANILLEVLKLMKVKPSALTEH
ncbi:MAG: carbon starvation protein A [Candidatus Omnitrophica bacterium]|nr:carbon starvation protein A [Candidatus Omnitrophota bacterium]